MKKLLVDTNIILDLLAKREPHYTAASKLFSLADRNKLTLSISSLSIANTNYVLTKLMTSEKAREILRRFRLLVTVLSLDDKIVELALNDSAFIDFEDGLQYHSALENGLEIIISRDSKGFKHSRLPVMSAEEFILSANNSG